MKMVFIRGSAEEGDGPRVGPAAALWRPPHAGGPLGAGVLGNAAELCAAALAAEGGRDAGETA